MKSRWIVAPDRPLMTEMLSRELSIEPLLAQCLVNRNIEDLAAAREFLDPKLRSLRDPFDLPEMNRAVERIWHCRAQQEKILVFGDYDVDGVTSVSMLVEFFRELGCSVESFLPRRLEEGYGLSQAAVELCYEKHRPHVVLAIDCGSTAIEPIQWLKARGVDVIVVDHHQLAGARPAAVALVNPHADETSGHGRELCSAGLAFKLIHAVVKRGRALGDSVCATCDVRKFLDLVALGTIADLVPLTGENRILTHHGLEHLRTTSRLGLVALKTVSRTATPLGVFDVGFQLAPRLNAAGRLENAEDALNLLLARAPDDAEALAKALDSRNRERQEIERQITDEAIGSIRTRFDPSSDFVIVEARLLWHVGVVGIVASRVLREFYRPTLILGGDGDEWRGSGRSIAGFDLAAALRECSEHLVRHGGHAMAAGLSIHPDKVDRLRIQLNEIARGCLRPDQLIPELQLDGRLTLSAASLDFVEQLQVIGPFGQGNAELRWMVPGLRLTQPPLRMGKQQQHIKWRVTDGQATGEVVWWNGGKEPQPTGRFEMAAIANIHEYNGRRSVQWRLLDWRPALNLSKNPLD